MSLSDSRTPMIRTSCRTAVDSPARRRRPAFTLLEVLVATGLSVMLMVAVVAAVDLYRQVSTTGRDQLAEAQLARAILQMIERDLRGVTFSVAPEEDLDPSAESDAAEAFVVEVDSTAAMFGLSGGITGDATTLVIHGQRPERHSGLGPAGNDPLTTAGGARSDLRSTAYFVTVPGSSGLPGLAAELLTQRGQHPSGLARMEGDRLVLMFADQAGDSQRLLENVHILAAEVTWLEFRYLDEVSGYDAWDSAVLGGLPRAVEIHLGLRLDGDVAQEPTRIYRHVVAIAVAEPNPAVSSLTAF